MYRVVFLHGLEGSPSGRKAQYLASRYDLLAPFLDTTKARAFAASASESGVLPPESFAEPLAQAQAAVDEHNPDVVIGSSFGGGLATQLRWEGPLVLLAPALARFGVTSLPPNQKIAIIHGTMDDVIPIQDSMEAAGAGHLLYGAEDDHSLLKTVTEEGACEQAIALLLDS